MPRWKNRKSMQKNGENKNENGVDPVGQGTMRLKAPTDLKILHLCRLCESKEGPYVQIFETEKVSKQIEYVMPFSITKTDGLPHTICFRCVAKVDELHEFINKCIKTQENLHHMLGKNPPVVAQTKSQERLWWEKKLMASNKSHEDICDEVVKKAMQAIITTNEVNLPVVTNNTNKQTNTAPTSKAPEPPKAAATSKFTNENTASAAKTEKQPKADTVAPKPTPVPTKATRSKKISTPTTQPPKSNAKSVNSAEEDDEPEVMFVKDDIDLKIESIPFLNTIKVHGVGLLYQCSLCNRNFLNKNVVITHSCVKNHKNKPQTVEKPPPPRIEVPKPDSVKFINTSYVTQDDVNKSTKPKAGPASKTGRRTLDTDVKSDEEIKPIYAPTMTPQQLKALYSKNSYVFVPCPGNKFVLEKKKDLETDTSIEKITKENRPHQSHTVTSATVSKASASSEPYPVALFHIKKQPVGGPDSKKEIQKNTVTPDEPTDYTCNICNEKFNRQQKLAAHIQCHFQEEFSKPKPKRMRNK